MRSVILALLLAGCVQSVGELDVSQEVAERGITVGQSPSGDPLFVHSGFGHWSIDCNCSTSFLAYYADGTLVRFSEGVQQPTNLTQSIQNFTGQDFSPISDVSILRLDASWLTPYVIDSFDEFESCWAFHFAGGPHSMLYTAYAASESDCSNKNAAAFQVSDALWDISESSY